MRIWSRARQLAAQTPESRNRFVDFLRAASILVVIVGHWLIQAIHYADGEIRFGHLFEIQPATQWLTWLFQVMPVFFIVGGYANAVSLESARRRGLGYAGWLSARLARLMTPLIVLLLAWALLSLLMLRLGADAALVQFASRAALIPTWFLAIYILVVVLAPAMYRFWRRSGFVSTAILVALAVAMDGAFFALDLRWPSWSNYFWIWLAIHNLGFAWRDGRLGPAAQRLLYAAVGLAALWLLVFHGPYPLTMVGYPGIEISNTTPPKITLLALGLFQFGLLMAIEKPMRRALAGPRLWSATVLINSLIMTVYLWHITLSVLLIALLYKLGGTGLGFEPGSVAWWWSRPLWIALLAVLLLPVALLLSPLERGARRTGVSDVSAARQVGGAMLACLGVALLARFGFGNSPLAGLDIGALGLVVGGAALAGLLGRLGRA